MSREIVLRKTVARNGAHERTRRGEEGGTEEQGRRLGLISGISKTPSAAACCSTTDVVVYIAAGREPSDISRLPTDRREDRRDRRENR